MSAVFNGYNQLEEVRTKPVIEVRVLQNSLCLLSSNEEVESENAIVEKSQWLHSVSQIPSSKR